MRVQVMWDVSSLNVNIESMGDDRWIRKIRELDWLKFRSVLNSPQTSMIESDDASRLTGRLSRQNPDRPSFVTKMRSYGFTDLTCGLGIFRCDRFGCSHAGSPHKCGKWPLKTGKFLDRMENSRRNYFLKDTRFWFAPQTSHLALRG